MNNPLIMPNRQVPYSTDFLTYNNLDQVVIIPTDYHASAGAPPLDPPLPLTIGISRNISPPPPNHVTYDVDVAYNSPTGTVDLIFRIDFDLTAPPPGQTGSF